MHTVPHGCWSHVPCTPDLPGYALAVWSGTSHFVSLVLFPSLQGENVLLSHLTGLVVLMGSVSLMQVKDLLFEAKLQFKNVLRPYETLICEDI